MSHTDNCWSDDIWIQVFSKLPQPEPCTYGSNGRLSRDDIDQLQSEIWSCTRLKLQLRLVSKRLRDLVDQNPPLSACLAVTKSLPSESVSSLVQHLKGSGPYIRYFLGCCQSPATDVVAAAILSFAAQLEKAVILNTSSNMPSILSAFDNLKTCDLRTTAATPVNLGPLRVLPNLSVLDLGDGPFHDIHTLSHLSALNLWHAQLTAQHWQSVSNLQHLRLVISYWSGLQFGLTACTALTNLMCLRSAVTASTRQESLDSGVTDDPHFPQGSTMTQLSVLSLEIRGKTHDASDRWIYTLCNLEHLSLSFCGCSVNKHLGQDLTGLSKLTSLSLDLNRGSRLFLNVNWKHMHALRKADFKVGTIMLSDGIQGLSQLKRLQNLSFDCHNVDQRSARLLKNLLRDFAAGLPYMHCQCSVKGEFVSKLNEVAPLY